MSERKNPIDELTENIENAKEEISNASMRSELIQSSESGEIEQSIAHIKKASAKVVEKIYKQLKAKRLERANSFITDMLISRLADTLKGLDAIESSEELNKDLQKDKLLKKDVESIMSYITPFLPLIGIISGGIAVAGHIYKHKTNEPESDDSSESQSSQGPT